MNISPFFLKPGGLWRLVSMGKPEISEVSPQRLGPVAAAWNAHLQRLVLRRMRRVCGWHLVDFFKGPWLQKTSYPSLAKRSNIWLMAKNQAILTSWSVGSWKRRVLDIPTVVFWADFWINHHKKSEGFSLFGSVKATWQLWKAPLTVHWQLIGKLVVSSRFSNICMSQIRSFLHAGINIT